MDGSDSIYPNDRLRQERMARNWRQQDIADQVGTTVVTVTRWERGNQQPSAYFRIKLCALFGKSVEELGLIAEDPQPQTTTLIKTSPPVESYTTSLHHGSRDAHPQPDPLTATISALSQMSRPTPVIAQQAVQQTQNRRHMVRRLSRSYHNILIQSLQGMVWIELGLSQKPDAVQNATHLIFRASSQTERDLPAGTSILQVYDEAEQELLILGAPGVGKSTLLLNLAQQLVTRAEQDETQPLPIILPLSSWAIKRSDLQDWISEQLTTIYDVPRQVSEDWIHTEHILPLLDGLDEMDASARPDCIAAINDYHRHHLNPLVVCSRHVEYDHAAERQRLLLHSAVQVQPLSPQQVETCVGTLGTSQVALRHALQGNAILQELATTPLMLNVLLLTSQDLPLLDVAAERDQVQQQVWTAYLQRLVTCKGDGHRYPLSQTRDWLGWLARQMRDHNMTVFYLEHLQPDWLPAGRERRWYERLATRGPGVIIGIIVSLFIMTLLFGISSLPTEIWYVCMGGLVGGLISGESTSGFQLEKKRRLSFQQWRSLSLLGVGNGVLMGGLVGVGFTLWPDHFLNGIIPGSCAGIFGCLLTLLLVSGKRIVRQDISSISRQSWWRRFLPPGLRLDHLCFGMILGLLFGLSYGLSYWLSNVVLGLRNWELGPELVGSVLGSVLSSGITGVLLSLLLLGKKSAIEPTEVLVWSEKRIRRSLLSKQHVRTSLYLLLIVFLFIGLSIELSIGLIIGVVDLFIGPASAGAGLGQGPGTSQIPIYHRLSLDLSHIDLRVGLSIGLSFGLAYWLIVGLWNGLSRERLDDHLRTQPNEGITRSVRSALLVGMLAGVICFLMSLLSTFISSFFALSQPYWLSTGLLLGGTGALLAALLTGGIASLRHLLLRLQLSRLGVVPWHSVRFLDDAASRVLLYKDGGGYRFIHRLFLDYCADLGASPFPLQQGTHHREHANQQSKNHLSENPIED